MRLTLRAMLAYLDEHCDWTPAEKADFGKRVEESKYASDLVERIRVSLRRPRLGAPKVEGRGIGLDANTVAEYIEGSLPAERIADFEKLCLESDVHLAEVAAAHEILSDVVAGIRTPARFALKEQICALGLPGGEERFRRSRTVAGKSSPIGTAASAGVLESAGNGVGLGDVAAPPILSPVSGAGAEPPIAAVSLSQNSTAMPWRGMAIALGFAFLLAIGGLRILGPFDGRHPLARWINGGRGDVALLGVDSPDVVATDDQSTSDLAKSDRNEIQDSTDSDAAGANRRDVVDNDATERKGSASPAGDPAERLREEAEQLGDKAKAGEKPVEKAAEGAGQPKPKASVATGGGTERPAPATPSDLAEPADSKKAGKPDAAGSAATEPAREVARLVSEEQVLAHTDSRDGLWYRLTRGMPLRSSQTYVALPFYRPQILVPNSTQIMVVGPVSFTLIPPPAGTMAGGIALHRGRALLATAGMPGTRVPLSLAGRQGTILFGDANAELAVEIRRYLPPGADPEEVAARVTRLFYTRRGSVEWHPEGGDPIRIGADQVLELIDDDEPVIESCVFPTWSEVRNVSKLDRDAFEQLEMLLSPDRPLTRSLEELQSFRKTEIRSLAARSLASLGEYDSLIRELANDQQHSYWERAVDDLREALAQSPEEASRIRNAFQRIRGEDAKVLHRMLRDYSPEQLAREGGASELVGFLDHKSLDVRVLAFETLRRITGVTLYYRPESPAERRRVPLQKWRERLKEGQIVHKTPPGPPPVVERKPAAK